MKRLLAGIALCIVSVVVPAFAQTNVALSEKFVHILSDGQYENAAAMFDPALQQVTPSLMQSTWQQLQAAYGPYLSYYVPEGTAADANPVILGLRFEKSTRGFACNFNAKQQLTGFLLAPAPPDPLLPVSSATNIPSAFPETDVYVPVAGGTLSGTLMQPGNAPAAGPVALIVAGSGPTDRNGNNAEWLQTNAYRMLAEALAAEGIASLRYDKRMVGASKGFAVDESKLRFDDYVQDAAALLRFLKKEKGYARVYLVGHSEGALVAMLAAQQEPVQALVSLCGPAENIASTLKRQLRNPDADLILEELLAGNLTTKVPPSLQVEFRASVQPYLISWMKYDPVKEIRKLRIPLLIVGGTTDMQVPAAEAGQLKLSAPEARLVVIKGMNHILKDAIADKAANQATYTQASLPLNKELVAVLQGFLRQK